MLLLLLLLLLLLQENRKIVRSIANKEQLHYDNFSVTMRNSWLGLRPGQLPKLPLLLELAASGARYFWGVVTFGEQKTLYKVCRTELFLGNRRWKFVTAVLKTRDTILRSSLNLCCCNVGGLFMSIPCCQWSTGKLVRCCKLFVLYDALLCYSAVTISQCDGRDCYLNLKKCSFWYPLLKIILIWIKVCFT